MIKGINRAIAQARVSVRMMPWARGQWEVQVWDDKRHAWVIGQVTDYRRAQSIARECRIREALRALNVADPEAEACQLVQDSGFRRWDEILRDWARTSEIVPVD